MRNVKRAPLLLAAVMLSAVAGNSAFATNGYFTHGIGTKNRGMAGAGLASPDDAISLANNPAAAVFAIGRLDVGASLFSPKRSYSSTPSMANGQGGAFTIGPNDLDSSNEYFVIPHIAYSWGLSEDSAIGLAFYGRGGMNTEWKGGTATFDPDGPMGPAPVMTLPGTFGDGTAGVDLSQAFLDIAYAGKPNDRFAWGAGLIFAAQTFKATGVGTFAGFTETLVSSGGMQMPDSLSGTGRDYSYGVGFKAGIQLSLSESVDFAAMYQSEISMGKFDKYSDLFAENGGFDIPANIKIGLTFHPRENLAISLDAEHIVYNDIPSVGNSIANLFSCPALNPMSSDFSGCLGGANGAGFGWDDMTIYKIGFEWGSNPDMTWRAGFSTGSQPIPEREVLFNILAPAVIEDHIAVGFSKMNSKGGEWSFSLMYAFENDVTGRNPFDPTQTITIAMDQFEAEASYSWRF